MSDSMQVDWAMMVKQTINEKPLAEAGYELARIVAFALKTQHDEQFARDVDACVKSFWARCERERDATPSPVGASVPLWTDERMNERATYFANEVDGNAGTYDLFIVALTEIRDDYEAARGASVPVPQDIAETLREALIYHRSESIIWASIEDNEDSVKRIDTALTWLERQGQG